MIAEGSLVRILPPFNIAFGGEYTITAWNTDAQAWTIDGVGDFAAEYLEEI